MRIYTKKSLTERFWAMVKKEDSCWSWIGCISSTGYGTIGDENGNSRNVHKVSYELVNGPVPEGLVVRHKCDNRACVNPAHLEIGTHAQNMADMVERGRAPFQKQTHCKKGHPLTSGKRQRVCKTCQHLAREKYIQKIGGHEEDNRRRMEQYYAKRSLNQQQQCLFL